MITYQKNMGKAVIEPPSNVVAGSSGSWEIIYTAGKSGISKGGKVSFGIPHGFSIPQIDNPFMPGYCTAECSRKGVSLVLRCTRSTSNALDYKRGEYGSINTGVMVHICERGLYSGDTIIFHYGNRSKGSPGSFVRSIEGPAVFTILVCPQDSWSDEAHFNFLKNAPLLQVVARASQKVHIVLPSIVKVADTVPVHITAKDEFENTVLENNIKFKISGAGALKNVGENINLKDKAVKTLVKAQKSGIGRLNITDIHPKDISLETNPVLVEEAGEGYNLYWGDLHCHSFVSDGLNDPAYLYQYAREIDRADFAAVTDHCYMSDEGWQECMEVAEKYNQDDKFVTLLGYEHSAPGIHRNVYYKGNRGKLVRAKRGEKVLRANLMGYAHGSGYKSRYKSVESTRELFDKLDKRENIVIPHIHQMDWENHNSELEPVVEIYSNWGSREYSGCRYASVAGTRVVDTVQYVLKLGYKLGFVGGGDGHGGRPGKDYWLRVRGARPGGITAIYAKELTRESLWEALKLRHCYATTGKRIIVRFHLNGSMMGEEVNLDVPDKPRELEVGIYGTSEITRATIVKNDMDAYVKCSNNSQIEFEWTDKEKAKSGDYYYLRVEQSDGAMAWSSPVWLS